MSLKQVHLQQARLILTIYFFFCFSLIQLYLSSAKESGIKAYAFERLVQLCMDNNCIDIIIDRARSVVEQSKDWKLKDQDRKSLYKTIANILD